MSIVSIFVSTSNSYTMLSKYLVGECWQSLYGMQRCNVFGHFRMVGIFDDDILQRTYHVLITVFENCAQDHAVSFFVPCNSPLNVALVAVLCRMTYG